MTATRWSPCYDPLTIENREGWYRSRPGWGEWRGRRGRCGPARAPRLWWRGAPGRVGG